MPNRAFQVCQEPQCGRLCHGRYCDRHTTANVKREARRLFDADRGSAHARGYDRMWRLQAKRVLMRDPFCQIGKPGDTRASSCQGYAPSRVVDHIIPGHKGRRVTDDELQGACKACHDWKTATQDSKFVTRSKPLNQRG